MSERSPDSFASDERTFPGAPPIVRHEGTSDAPGLAPESDDDPAERIAWNPFDLLFRPGRYFRGPGGRAPIWVVILLCWVIGIAAICEAPAIIGALAAAMSSGPSWPAFWVFVLIAGAASGVLQACIPGFFFHFRVFASGGVHAPPTQTFAIWSQARLLIAVPSVISMLVWTFVYDTPEAYAARLVAWWEIAAFAPLPLWSVLISFRGVRATIDVSKWASVWWLLVLPMGFFVVVIGGVALLAVFVMPSMGAPADVAHPRMLPRSTTYSLQYPRNWKAELDDEFGVASVYFEPPQDANLSIEMYWDDMSVADRIDQIEDHYRDSGLRSVGESTPIDEIAGIKGEGEERMFRGGLSVKYRSRILLSPLPDGYVLEIRELAAVAAGPSFDPGVELILSTLQVRTPADAPADVENAWLLEHTEFECMVPGDWQWYEEEDEDERFTAIQLVLPQDAWVRIMSYDSEIPPADEALATIEMAAEDDAWRIIEQFETEGGGRGAWFEVEHEAAPRRWVTLVYENGEGRALEAQASWFPGREELIRPGLELLIESLRPIEAPPPERDTEQDRPEDD